MNILASFQTWRRYRHTVNELNRLSIHELDDLGISRRDITSVARLASRRK